MLGADDAKALLGPPFCRIGWPAQSLPVSALPIGLCSGVLKGHWQGALLPPLWRWQASFPPQLRGCKAVLCSHSAGVITAGKSHLDMNDHDQLL